jgi:hypothetical protein
MELTSSQSRYAVTVAPVETLKRSPGDYLTTSAIADLLKANLGLNRKSVTVSRRSSLQYVTITIRAAAVDVKKVKEFARTLHTWTMDQTDYCQGQAVDVECTKEVNEAHGAPFIEEITRAVGEIRKTGSWLELSTGQHLNVGDQGYWVTRGYDRGCYIWAADVEAGKDWAIKALALQMARV